MKKITYISIAAMAMLFIASSCNPVDSIGIEENKDSIPILIPDPPKRIVPDSVIFTIEENMINLDSSSSELFNWSEDSSVKEYEIALDTTKQPAQIIFKLNLQNQIDEISTKRTFWFDSMVLEVDSMPVSGSAALNGGLESLAWASLVLKYVKPRKTTVNYFGPQSPVYIEFTDYVRTPDDIYLSGYITAQIRSDYNSALTLILEGKFEFIFNLTK